MYPTSTDKAKLLVIEDNRTMAEALKTFLSMDGFEVSLAFDGTNGLEKFKSQRPDCVALDLRLPGMDGIEVLEKIEQYDSTVPVIVISGMGTIDDAIKALKLGAWDYIKKPIPSLETLSRSLHRAIDRAARSRENRRYQRELEKQLDLKTKELQQAQKLEALGTLAGGIAHDFNNLLMVMNGYAEMGVIVSDSGSPCRSYFENIVAAGKRAQDITSQILRFSRRGQKEYLPLLIYPILKEGLKFVEAAMPPFIELRHKIYTGPDTVMGNPSELHQLLMNLFTNAIYAIGDKKGVIEVVLQRVTLDEEQGPYRDTDYVPCGGAYLELIIRDTGCGIDPAHMDRVFDAFFTTKPDGEGTGLGLSIVKNIVTSMGGVITVESAPMQGTTFFMLFPVADSDPCAMEACKETDLLRGDEAILLVDDNRPVLELTQHMLEYLGYRVTACETGLLAFDIFMDDPYAFDLAIIDQMLPNIPGTDLAERMLEIRPQFPIAMWTGFSSVLSPESARRLGAKCLLSKPLDIRTLSVAVRKALGDP